jgi:tetratricopeptide (TPR) repeat protein
MKTLNTMKTALLVSALLGAGLAHADPVTDGVNALESEWAKIYYQVPKPQQGHAYSQLLEKAVQLCKQYPKAAGAIFWQAVIKASYADHQDPVSALSAVHEVKDLLNHVIELDPKTMGGSAYVVLGTLYHMTPSWPIAFGDDDEAEKMFKTALTISPNGIDSNFYYGQFLQDKGNKDEALKYFQRASTAPVRPEQVFADTKLEEEAKVALKNAGGGSLSGKKEMFSNLNASAQVK